MARFAFLALLCIIVIATSLAAEAALTCGTVASSVAPCIPYVQRDVQTPPPGCCSGLTSLDKAATTTPDRQTVCTCLKSIAGNVQRADYAAVNALISQCGITDIPYKLSPTIDCSRVN